MTDMIVQSLLEENFYFTNSKFKHIQASKKTEIPTSLNNGSEHSVNESVSIECDRGSENIVTDCDTEDSILNNGKVCELHVTKKNDKSSRDGVQGENIACEDYKILATKTTVINTTYNLIAQSTTRALVNTMTGTEHSSWSSFPNVISEAVDKSRVVVQVLKSDQKSKSQNIIESKSSSPDNQNTHCFRDDLCKLLSNSQSSKLDGGDNRELFANTDALKEISSESQGSKTYIGKTRRKRNFSLYFWNGRGSKIGDLKCVCDNLRQASPASLRYLHYVMFNSFGLCGTGLQLLETKKNINGFCGYPFKRSSEQFQKKLKCLSKIPKQMLAEIHRAIFGKTADLNRSVMVDHLIDFLWMPRKCSEVLKKYENKIKCMSENEYAALKESALNGPLPSVVLQKLSENYIKRYISKDVKEKYETSEFESVVKDECTKMKNGFSHTIPAFILNGPGTKLKYFRKISKNVQTLPERPVKMLHYILYGRIEPSITDCRKNILEFNGFSDCQQEFVAERKDIIKKLNQKQLFELCKILCLRAKTNSREMRIKKILDYLQSPSKPAINKSHEKFRWSGPISPRYGHSEAYLQNRLSYKNVCKREKYPPVFKSSQSEFESSKFREKSPSMSSDYSDEIISGNGWKLRDFKRICSNIECAAPSDLIELNDLLFMKTCDESDIHQKILDFTGFNFPVSSLQHDSRKTLMHYMGFCVVKKIAHLLDIENWDKISNPEDLSSHVLKFLMRKVECPPCSKSSLSSSSKSLKDNICVVESTSPLSTKSEFESSSAVISSSTSVLENYSDIYPETPKSFKPEFYQQQKNQAVSHQKGNVIIQMLTKASLQNQEICQSNKSEESRSVKIFEGERFDQDSLSVKTAEDDSIHLRDLIHHPSEKELKELIYHLVKENLWCLTLGDVVQKVYECYPKVNLCYRESFIKSTVRQMLSELRDYAVRAVKDQTF